MAPPGVLAFLEVPLENGELYTTDQYGSPKTVKMHPDFKLFLTSPSGMYIFVGARY